MKKLLVVGCGYLGREIARHYAIAGWEVTAWTSSPASAERESSEIFRVSPVDIRDLDWVRRIGERDGSYDWVINCVSSKGGNAEQYREIYFNGTFNLVRGLIFSRMLYTGSTSVYGQIDGSQVDEDSTAEPMSETGKVLRETENLVLSRGGIVARLAGIYGPERSALLRRFKEGKSTLDADGSRWLNTIHRDDAVTALACLIDNNADNGIYNIADNGGITQLAAFEFLAQQLQLPVPPSASPDPHRKRGFTNKYVLNHKVKDLGWEPKFPTIIDGLREELAV